MAEHRDFPPAQRSFSPSLEDVLRELDLGAADVIVGHLHEGMLDDESHHLANARLACRALRDLVDGSSLRLHLKPDTIPLEDTPALSRWPRVTSVELKVLDIPAQPLSTLLVQPFVDQPEEARRRITSLHVLTYTGYDGGSVPAPVIMQLSSLLPRLQELQLEALHPSSLDCTPADLRFIYGALSQLPSFKSLGLPSCAAIPGIEALTGTLERLVVGFYINYAGVLTEAAVASMQQLHSLTLISMQGVSVSRLTLTDNDETEQLVWAGGLHGLLSALPPALERLYWYDKHARQHLVFDLTRGGVSSSFQVSASSIALQQLAGLAAQLPLSSSALELVPLQLKINRLNAFGIDPDGREPLRALMQRYISVPMSATGNAQAQGETLQPPAVNPLPPPPAVLLRALDQLASQPPDQGGYGPHSMLLLLRGPTAAALSELDEDQLEAWAMRVERRAEAAVLAAGAGQAEGGRSGVMLKGVQAMPPAAALVVECGGVEGAAAAVAAALEGEGLEVVTVPLEGAAFEWVKHNDLKLDNFWKIYTLHDAQAQQVAACLLSGMASTRDGYLVLTALPWALRQVMSEAWEAASPGVELSQQLEWVFGVRDMLMEFPAFVGAA